MRHNGPTRSEYRNRKGGAPLVHLASLDREQYSLPTLAPRAPAISSETMWFEQRSFDVAQFAADRIVRVSASLSALLGYGANELEHLPLRQLVDPDSLPRMLNAFRVLAEGRCAQSELDILWTPRDTHPVPCSLELLGIEAAGGTEILALSRRRNAKEALEGHRLALHGAFLSVNEPIAVFDKDGNVVDFNEALATFNRFPDREAMRTVLAVLGDYLEIQSLDGQVLARSDWPSGRALRGEIGRNAEFRFRRKDTDETWLCSFNFAPVRDAAGAIMGAAVIARDITEVTQAVDALRRSYGDLETVVEERTKALVQAKLEADRANAGKTRFLAAASHDLRQPLQSASAYLGSLDTLIEGRAAKEMSKGLRNSLDVMTELLNTLLDISRLQSGAIEPSLETFPIADVLRRAMLDHAPAAEAKRLALRMHLEPCTVRTDRALLMRIVENLLSNAIRYTESGHITIANRLNGDDVTLEVSDSGVGIPPESLELIFEEYYQMENKSRDRTSGLGLGLAIVRHLTRLLGHELVVASTVGKGTSFSVSLPYGTESVVRSRGTVRVKHEEAHAPVVLVVDDEPAIRHSLSMLLNAHGMVVHTAHDAAAAMQILQEGLSPDLLLTDYRLPQTSGSELVRQIRGAGWTRVSCIIMTGDTNSNEALQKEVDRCLVLRKPIDGVRLPHIIRDAIATWQA